ncbi:MAG: hypothetical protein AMS17_07600 [Spirochaetes bacterium DG_61]|nr:MAG: hypothetical protein AMS17_07600 [Spirochaetes bacterium DG_61]
MIEIKMPEAGFSITEGTVIEWYKEVGDKVEEGENVVSVETDKITVEVPAERSGILHEVKYAAGEVVPVHKKEEKEKAVKVEGGHRVKDEKDRRISPAAKAVAKAKGVNLSQIKTGTGPHGRIVKQDVLDFISRPAVAPVRSEITTAGTAAERVQEKVGAEKRTRIEFKAWRKVIADRMTASKRDIPHYTMSIEADVTELSRTM